MRSVVISYLLFILVFEGHTQSNTHRTEKYYTKILKEKDLSKLNLFFGLMPKGGDIHHHYAGAHYAETYLDWANDDNLTIDTITFNVSNTHNPSCVTVEHIRGSAILYRKLLSTWSIMDYTGNDLPPDLKFFGTFHYFSVLCIRNYRAGFQILKDRAIAENIQYIETILSDVDILPATYSRLSGFDAILLEAQDTHSEQDANIHFSEILGYLTTDSVHDRVIDFINILDRDRRGIDDGDFMMRYQVYAIRENMPSKVFASLYAAFLVCAANNAVVGVNLVGPENGVIATRDYWLHMHMIKYLKNLDEFVNIKLALHAGELVTGMVRPDDMGYHIGNALDIAGAERIGHGVAISTEQNSLGILEYMATNKKAIEINLSSNEFILGVSGHSHSVALYHDAGVPIVISTDDAGVLRSDLTNEFVLLAKRYGFSYGDMKSFVYNSIRYSFMTISEKEYNIKLLDSKFMEFEKSIVKFSKE